MVETEALYIEIIEPLGHIAHVKPQTIISMAGASTHNHLLNLFS